MSTQDELCKQVATRLIEIQERVAAAAARAGRSAAEVQLMAVTKTFGVDRVHAALRAGMTLLGENRVQEAVVKFAGWPADFTTAGGGPPRLHLIGHLQRNKAARVPGLFDCVQSLDKLETAQALQARLPPTPLGSRPGVPLSVLVEVNTSGEASKAGVEPAAAAALLTAIQDQCPGLQADGLMTVGPLTQDLAVVRAAFARLADLRRRLEANHPGLTTLSMGMSGDFEVAVEEGSTLVRLGTTLFGARPPR